MYRVFLHPDIEKQLQRLPRPFLERIAHVIRGLGNLPRPAQVKALGQELYRLRLGDYRIVYAVFDDEQVVFVGKVARRSEKTYRDLPALLAAARQAITTLPKPSPTLPAPVAAKPAASVRKKTPPKKKRPG
jgi:mRNA interferase RelE/StbE